MYCTRCLIYTIIFICTLQMSALQEFCATTKDYCPPGIPGPPGKLYTNVPCVVSEGIADCCLHVQLQCIAVELSCC